MTDTAEMFDFFSGLPHRVADAGLSPEQVTAVAQLLEDFADHLETTGYGSEPADGPDPDGFPGDAGRIAEAALRIEGSLRGLDPQGWHVRLGEDHVDERAASVRRDLIEDYGFPVD